MKYKKKPLILFSILLMLIIGIGAFLLFILLGENESTDVSKTTQTQSKTGIYTELVPTSALWTNAEDDTYIVSSLYPIESKTVYLNQFPQWVAEGYAKELKQAFNASNRIIGYVNEEPIYYRDFLYNKAGANLTYNDNVAMTLTENETRVYSQTTQMTDDDILNYMIEEMVMEQEAKRLGIVDDEQEIKQLAEESYRQKQEGMPKVLEAVKKELGFTKTEFIERIEMPSVRARRRQVKSMEKLYPNAKNLSEQWSDYREHINELINKSNIEKLPLQ